MISVTGIFHTIILLGGLQGIITGCLLFFIQPRYRSNRILAVLIWLMALASINLYVEYTGWYYSTTTIAIIHAIVPMVVLMPAGPLIYFYIQSLIDPSFTISRRQRLHFLPVIIDLIPSITVLIYLSGTALGFISAGSASWGIFIDEYNVYSDIPRWISLTCYLGFSAKYLSKQAGKPAAGKWIQQFIRIFLVFLAVWLLYLIPYVIPAYTDMMLARFKWYPVYLPLAIMIYWLGIKGYILSYQQNSVFKKKAGSLSALSPVVIEETVLLLRKSMDEDKLYLKPDLNLAMLAQHINSSPKTISAILNQHMQKNFNEFVSQYRVNALKQKLQQGGMDNLTITGIALECGFNSKASFQRVFRELTGLSPSEFRKSYAKTGK